MVRRSEEKVVTTKPCPFNGPGEITINDILNGPEEMLNKGRAFTHTFLNPGSGLGYHVHKGDGETYYILKGRGIYNNNGTEVEVGPGDVTYCGPGEGHCITAIGDEPLEFIGLILYE